MYFCSPTGSSLAEQIPQGYAGSVAGREKSTSITISTDTHVVSGSFRLNDYMKLDLFPDERDDYSTNATAAARNHASSQPLGIARSPSQDDLRSIEPADGTKTELCVAAGEIESMRYEDIVAAIVAHPEQYIDVLQYLSAAGSFDRAMDHINEINVSVQICA